VKRELPRKAIHLAMAFIPISSFYLDRQHIIQLTGVLLILALVVEVVRRTIPRINQQFTGLVGGMLRDKESSKLTGATYLILASFLSFFFLELWIAQVVIFFVVISDGLSAIFGLWIGKHRCFGNKTWEGNAVFVFTAFLIILIHPQCPLWLGILGVGTAFIADVLSTRWDDNWTIPLFSGLVMQLASLINV